MAKICFSEADWIEVAVAFGTGFANPCFYRAESRLPANACIATRIRATRSGLGTTAMGGGFNRSAQHTSHCSGRRSVANEVPETDVLHRRAKGIDVGALEGRLDAS